MKIATHREIDNRLCGNPVETKNGYSRVTLKTVQEMAADEQGLVHGGFVFGMADYAAMIAVNHPHVVLGSADVKFLKPVAVGQDLVAEAGVTETRGKKRMVKVTVCRNGEPVFSGEFTCFVPDSHVLENT
ncbi:MAG: hotdog domain-containing protein [Desulfobacterales bacterium]